MKKRSPEHAVWPVCANLELNMEKYIAIGTIAAYPRLGDAESVKRNVPLH